MKVAINKILHHKLQSLVSFLKQMHRGFETIADEIDCSNLKTAMIAVAVESKQYAKEIHDQLHHFDVTISEECTGQFWATIEQSIQAQMEDKKGSEVVALCNHCENYFTQLYQDVLQENLPFKNLKAIITFQLYAIECAFMKIRLLNTLRFSE